MRVTRRIAAYALLAVLMAACADLSVENLNEPDRERALATPGDVETLIAGSFLTWFRVDQDYYSAGMALSVMADEASSSWGNSYMREGSIEPRQAIPNDPSHGYRRAFENPWFWSYSAISAVRDGLIAIAGEDGQLFTDDDMEIGDDGVDTPRAITFAKFVQGLAHGYLGLLYDRAFIVDETTDLDALQPETFAEDVRPYAEVSAAGLAYLQEAVDLAGQYTFSVPQDWVGNGGGLTDNTDLARVARSYMARITAGTPRTVAERDAVNWGTVLSYANAGITADFWVMGDGYVKWYSDFKWCLVQLGWARTDLRFIGAAGSTAESNQRWTDWLATDPWSRQPFDIDSDDARMPILPGGVPGSHTMNEGWECVNVAERTDGCGLYIEYRDPYLPFRPERGSFHFSGYADYRWQEYTDDEIGPIMLYNVAENEMLKAESYIRNGQAASALPLINNTREANGQLPAATAAGAPDVGGRCTPRMTNGNCADLLETFKYEKRIEVYVTGLGVAFWDDRGWGDLVTNTPIQWPIPAKELLTLLQEVYTFGGGGPGSAPDIVSWSVADGDGLRPLRIGEVPSPDDIAARVRLFQTINNADPGSLYRQ